MTTIQERYTLAARAGRLGDSGPAAVLGAAGMAGQRGDGLGVLLMRLRAEVDAVAPQEIRQAADDASARALVLMRLQTLRPARDALGLHAARLAVRLRTTLEVDERADVVSAALLHWLWDRCEACTGRGSLGAYGSVQHVCRACKGSGRIRPQVRMGDAGLMLRELLGDMDRKAGRQAQEMVRALR